MYEWYKAYPMHIVGNVMFAKILQLYAVKMDAWKCNVEAETEWPQFCKHFQIHLLYENCRILI